MKTRWPVLFLTSCATLADGGPGTENAPSTRAGPFRLLVVGELAGNLVAPFVTSLTGLDQDLRVRDLSVIDPDGDPATFEVDGYFAASAAGAGADEPSTQIVVAHAIDGRTFSSERTAVLEPTESWEGGRVGSPSPMLGLEGDLRLYYEAEGGIGVATGSPLASKGQPVLTQADVPWATAPLKSPSVVLLRDDTYRLYFETERDGHASIGVASSNDGETFTDLGPILEPAGDEEAIDVAYVGSPFAVVGIGSAGREILYVYYAAMDATEKQTISMAARFLDSSDETLTKSNAAMYGPTGGVAPREPCVVRFDTFTILFATQKTARDANSLIVAAGVSPGDVELPTPAL